MRVRPLENYKLLGTEIELDKTKVYDAVPATNLSDCEAEGLIFVDDDYHFGFLLRQGEYTEVDNEMSIVFDKALNV